MAKKVSVRSLGFGLTEVTTTDHEGGKCEMELFGEREELIVGVSLEVVSSQRGPVIAANKAYDDFWENMDWSLNPWKNKPN